MKRITTPETALTRTRLKVRLNVAVGLLERFQGLHNDLRHAPLPAVDHLPRRRREPHTADGHRDAVLGLWAAARALTASFGFGLTHGRPP